jgi:O-antigen/teichoic acid export membrane protein
MKQQTVGKSPDGRSAAISAVVWVVASRLFSQVSQVAIFFIAMRMLLPAEFGLYAVISSIGILGAVIAEGGWAEFLMKARQRRDEFDQVATIAFLSGAFVSLGGLTVSLFLSRILDLPEAGALLALFSCWTMLSVASSVFEGALVAEGQFRKQAWIRIGAELAGLIAAILGLMQGLGSVALVYGRIITQFVTLVASVLVFGRFPRLAFSREMTMALLAFSKHVVANRFVVFLGSYSGTLALGASVGVVEAGYYRAAERLVSAVSEFLGEPTKTLSWRYFRQAQQNQDAGIPQAVTKMSVRFLTGLLLAGAPAYLGLALVAPSAVEILLGVAWLPAVPIVAILCLRQFLLLPGYITEPLVTVTGHFRRRLPVTLLNVAVAVFVVVIFAPYGVTALAIAQCGAAAFAISMSIRLQIVYGRADWPTVGKNFTTFGLVPAVALSIVVTLVPIWAIGLREIEVLGLQVVAGAIVFVTLSFLAFHLARRPSA